MKIIVLIFFFLLVFLSIVAVIFMLASVVSRVRRGKSNRKESSRISRDGKKQIILFHMLAEYYGGLKKATNDELKEMFEKGLSFREKRKFPEAIRIFKKCLDQNLTFEQKIGLFVTTGNCCFAADKLDMAQRYYEKANGLARESDNINGRLSGLINLGLVYAADQKWDQAITNYHEAISLDQKSGYVKGEAIDLNTLGLLYENKGDLEGALTHYTASLLIFEKLNNREKAEVVENNIRRVENLGVDAKIRD